MADVTFVGKVGGNLTGTVSSKAHVVAHGDNACAQGPHAVEAEGSLELDGSYTVVVPLPKSETLCAVFTFSANYPPPPPDPGSNGVIEGRRFIVPPIQVRDIKPEDGLVVVVGIPSITITIPRPE